MPSPGWGKDVYFAMIFSNVLPGISGPFFGLFFFVFLWLFFGVLFLPQINWVRSTGSAAFLLNNKRLEVPRRHIFHCPGGKMWAKNGMKMRDQGGVSFIEGASERKPNPRQVRVGTRKWNKQRKNVI